MESFDISRVHWEKGKFQPWYLDQKPINLKDLKYKSDEELIVISLSGKQYGFLLREVVYHHIIQGELNGIDFILTFCGVCNAGVLLSPVIKNKLYHYKETGVYNGQQIFEDIETHTLWNHLTGEALFGELIGNTLEYIGSLNMTTIGEANESIPDLPIYISGKKKIYGNIMRFVIKVILGERNKNWLPPHFTKTLPEVNNALPKMTMGLAIKIKDKLRFYPVELFKENELSDIFNGIKITLKMENKIPKAKTETGEIPFQLFTRWYAFILTYPDGELFKKEY
jgi:hypothetical protein